MQEACLSLAARAGSGFISSGQQSDHLLLVAAYNAWEDAKAQVQLPFPPTEDTARERIFKGWTPFHMPSVLEHGHGPYPHKPLCSFYNGLRMMKDTLTALASSQISAVQGGRQAAASFTRKHMLSGQTLEMLGDMRGQFASMLADIGFVRAPGRGGARGPKGSAAWVDDRKAAWNQHSAQPAVVCAPCTSTAAGLL